MKITGNIFLLLMLLWGLYACTSEPLDTDDDSMPETRGVMEIEILQEEGIADDKMNTIRFLVFKQTSGFPELELNRLFDVPAAATSGEVSRLRVILEVSKKQNSDNKKIVVAIVNEPQTKTATLNALPNLSELENEILHFADFLNDDHSTLSPGGKGLPMTGVIETDKVYATEGEAASNLVPLTIERAVARVEVYLRKEAGMTIDLTTASKIELKNTYDKEYFLYHKEGSNTFGQIQEVEESDLFSKTWNPAETIPDSSIPDSGEGALLCYFYTPERTCITPNDADKLVLKMELVTSGGAVRAKEVILDTATKEGEIQPTPLTEIRRNNSYKILATVGNHDAQIKFTIVYKAWEIKQQNITFD